MRGDVAASAEVDDDGNPDARSSPKRSLGSRVKGSLKGAGRMAQGLWGLGKIITGYNLAIHGLFEADFRRGADKELVRETADSPLPKFFHGY